MILLTDLVIAVCFFYFGYKQGSASERVMQYDNYIKWQEEDEKLSLRQVQKAVV